jgi:cytochrome c553
MSDLIVFAVFIAAAILFAWLSLRLRNAKNISLRWFGAGLTGLAALALTLICITAAVGFYELRHSRSVAVPELHVEGSVAQMRRGQAIADGFCGACHSRSGTLTGGEDIGKHLPVDLGSFISANLTAAGPLKDWSDGQIFRAIRNSVDAEGRRLVIMSLTNAGRLSDDDIRALIAYIRTATGFRPASRSKPARSSRLPRRRPSLTANTSCPIRIAGNATARN